ncbi:phosphopentomutase [Calorimonas adulescens]|jgi:Metalloenzyme superfamily.|uniref:Phosphopentomutase n=1 Tax=Calorimonas adulescens TaxID=2606906 RepID=A0A5D8Q879_9THEO|nr:phosphopentomutase [Calorimonas adulescens]TZE80975.1 phosphopentomutase [Calorimonas adulescens]
MRRVILLVIDSLGVGEMDDVDAVRPHDKGANTLKHVAEQSNLNIPNLEKMGAGYVVELDKIKRVEEPIASFGSSNLAHFGADTYQGHQEIMGTKPRMPVMKPFIYYIDKVERALTDAGYDVERPDPSHPYLLVNGLVTVADNIEADPGQNYNLTAPLDYISFEEELKIGRIVRENVEVGRVIVFGGRGVTIKDILNAVEVKEGDITGINAPKSGVYRNGYIVRHLGYGVNPDVQVPTILKRAGYDVSLIGKMADVIGCDGAEYMPMVETEGVLDLILEKIKAQDSGLIAANVQETDLAGHSQDPVRYGEKLMTVDRYLPRIMDGMNDEDLLIITGDHGNDPTIGHSHHTRERAILLVYGRKLKTVDLGIRNTLSDIGATIAEFFRVAMPENGASFLNLL